MSFRVLSTFILGVVGLTLLLISRFFDTLPVFSTSLALIGSFWGLWNLISLLFKNITLSSRGKAFLIMGTALSLVSFLLDDYGDMVVFWLPGALVSLLSLRITINILNKIANTTTNALQTKVSQMEEQLQKDKQLPHS